ncbi:MAG: aminotransferase class IV [Micromonosporaceae bacterium]
MRIEIDGRTATAEQLGYPALVNYGHYSSMQVRDGRVRGLDLHLARLAGATRELFDASLDGSLVRDRIRHALGGTPDASVQVRIFSPADTPSIMVAVQDPVDMPAAPWRLTSVRYLRPLAYLKHVGSFGQAYYGRLAEQAGYDDALLTGPDGLIAETGIANIGFLTGDTVVWPDAPSLPGITRQLLERGLGSRSRRRVVTLADLDQYDGAFVCNSWGVAPVGQIDGRQLPTDAAATDRLVMLYDAVPADQI